MLPQGKEAYMTHGMEDYFEPALHITRSDGNPSTLLKYKRHETKACDGGTETVIYLADPVYADEVAMHFVAYAKEDVFKAWTEIFNREKSAITLEKYASSMLHMYAPKYYLTQYNGDWATGQPHAGALLRQEGDRHQAGSARRHVLPALLPAVARQQGH